MITQILLDANTQEELLEGASSGVGFGDRIVADSPIVREIADTLSKQFERQLTPRKVGIAQIKTRAGRIGENTENVIAKIDKAEAANLDLLVFPELTLPGYLALDHFTEKRFIDANLRALESIAEATKEKKVVAVVGFADREEGEFGDKIYNAAAVIHDGKVVDVVRKSLLPEYDIFWERRYFETAPQRHIVNVNGFRLGIGICEDLWDSKYATKVYDELAKEGADYFINLSASPFQPAKVGTRHELIEGVVGKHHKPFIYANLVGAQDGYEGEVVFDGRSMVVAGDGKLVAIGNGFDEDFVIVDHVEANEIVLPTWTSVEETFWALALGLKDFFARTGNTHGYVGLSGGIDSAVVAALLEAALGAENVFGATLPSKVTSSETKNDALILASNMGIKCVTWPIIEQYAAWKAGAEVAVKELTGLDLPGLACENAQARDRGKALMTFTNTDKRGLLVTTGNKTEMALGYCTLYGDMSGAINPLGDVNKEMVYELARYYNELRGREVIPQSIIDRPPTAELAEGQTDEKGLGAPYSILSPLVEEVVEDRTAREELLTRYPVEIVDKVIRLTQINEFKRRQAAPGIRVTNKAFGAGRRFPIDSNYY